MSFGHETGCGFTDRQNKHVPTEVNIRDTFQESVVTIFAGQMRSTAVTESGKILSWGEWFDGQKQREPTEILITLPQNDKVKKVANGKMHSIILTDRGKVYSIGDNTYGELGLPREITYKSSPTVIPFFEDK